MSPTPHSLIAGPLPYRQVVCLRRVGGAPFIDDGAIDTLIIVPNSISFGWSFKMLSSSGRMSLVR